MLPVWLNAGYLVLVVIISVAIRMWEMLPFIIVCAGLSFLYMNSIGTNNVVDIQTGTVVIHVSLLLIMIVLAFIFGVLQKLFGYLYYFVAAMAGLGGLYGIYYVYQWIISTQYLGEIGNWFTDFPEKFTQFKIIAYILSLLAGIPIFIASLGYLLPALYASFMGFPFTFPIITLLFSLLSYFVYASFPLLDTTSTNAIKCIILGLLIVSLLSGIAYQQHMTTADIKYTSLRIFLFVAGISGIIALIMFLLNLTIHPIMWTIIIYIIISLITILGLGFIYSILPPFIKEIIIMIIHKIKEIMLYLWDEYKKTTILVFVAIILEVLYLLYTVFKYSVNTEDQGTLVQKNPISLNNRITPSLQSDSRSYEYGISMWVNIQPQSPDISPSSTIFTSILNYSNVPNITYNSSLNTLRVTMREQNNKIIVIADITNISLQTWNSIIINYANGIMDIFYNGILIKSRLNIIPYATKTTLTIGTNSGVIGEIAQVRFFDKVISEKKIKKMSALFNF